MAAGTKGARARPHQHLRKFPLAPPCTSQPLLTPKGLTAPKLIVTRIWGEDCNCSKGEQFQQFQQKHHSRMPAIHVPLTSEMQIKSPNYLALGKKENKRGKGEFDLSRDCITLHSQMVSHIKGPCRWKPIIAGSQMPVQCRSDEGI